MIRRAPDGIQSIKIIGEAGDIDRAMWLEARKPHVTASTVGALFGVHEYETLFSLWHQKAGTVEAGDDDSPAMKRGRMLEPVAMEMLKERPELVDLINPGRYYWDDTVRLGATPDCIAYEEGRGLGVVQIKSVAPQVFREKWCQGDDIEPPLWIALQALTEAHLTGSNWAKVAALIVDAGITLELIEIPISTKLIDTIRAKCSAFWTSIAEGVEPEPEYKADAATISRLYPVTDQEVEIDLTADVEFETATILLDMKRREVRRIKAEMNELEARIRHRLGNAAIAHLPGGRKVTLRTHKREGGYTKPSEYRRLSIKN